MESHHSKNRTLSIVAISALKFFKGIFFFSLTLVLFSISRMDPDDLADVLDMDFQINLLNYLWGHLATFIEALTPVKVRVAEGGFILYSLLNFFQGFGLIFQWKWGAFITIVEDGFMIPFEVFAIIQKFTFGLLGVFCMHLFIMVYLLKNWFLFENIPPDQLQKSTEVLGKDGPPETLERND